MSILLTATGLDNLLAAIWTGAGTCNILCPPAAPPAAPPTGAGAALPAKTGLEPTGTGPTGFCAPAPNWTLFAPTGTGRLAPTGAKENFIAVG